MARYRPLVPILSVALALAACDSQIRSTAVPASAAFGAASDVLATVTPGASGLQVTIQDPRQLPEAIRQAGDLKVAFGGTRVPVTRTPGGYYIFSIPANARVQQDVAGNLRVVFIMDDLGSQLVTLRSGSPVQFAQPPVLTAPSPAFIARGLDVRLTANTDASTEKYQFTWSYATTATGPWQPIPGEGKTVEWTPPLAGNFFVKVDAVDRATQQTYSTTAPAAVVFVTDAKEVITTDPPSGGVARGSSVKLRFNRPNGLVGDAPTYAWSIAPSPQGPWQTLSGASTDITWLPTATGSYFAKVEVSDLRTGKVNTFVSPQAVVFVTEGSPIVAANPSTASRGTRVALTLNLQVADGTSVNWFYSRTGNGPTAQWLPLAGTGRTNDLLVNEGGAYHFRVDVPDANGAIKTFITSEPVLNVTEGEPIVAATPRNAQRGDRVSLELKLGVPDGTRVNWFYSRTGNGPAAQWQPLSGTGRTNAFLVNEAGAYNFRVDVPDDNGAIKPFTTSDAALAVTEGNVPLITSEPRNNVVKQGAIVTLKLNARGVDETNFRFTWFISTSPFGPWNALPFERASDATMTTYQWKTRSTIKFPDGSEQRLTHPPGSYFVRVDAAEKNGPNVYTFTSSTPAVTIQTQ